MKAPHLQQHFHNLLAPLFPREAEFVRVSNDSNELLYRVLWKTPTIDRPNKSSRPIELHLTSETLEDYEDSHDAEFQRRADKRVVDHVRNLLAAFDPSHDVPSHIPVPAERWTIHTEVLGR
jgi:hypothetical protein